MPQVFSRRAQFCVKLVLLGAAILLAGAIALGVSVQRSFETIGEPVAQPIPFSHKHHVGDDGIDCRYCHTTVETAAEAGLPSTRICMGCHSQLYVDAPVLQPLRDSAATGRPLEWRRVHVLPDFVFFHHGVHVAKGVACLECHGHVEQMPLAWRASRLEMQWCFACHRNPDGRRVPHDLVFAMRSPAPDGDELAPRQSLSPIESERRRTDCSTCHR
jgi:hypothetical protein